VKNPEILLWIEVVVFLGSVLFAVADDRGGGHKDRDDFDFKDKRAVEGFRITHHR
jgi:hypothetical protein